VIDSGPVSAEDKLRDVPQEKWRDLMVARRYFMQDRLSHDCRCLVQFVDDAEMMFAALGYASAEDMIRTGYELEPGEIAVAVKWLELNKPSDAVSLDYVRALTYQRADEQDRANPSRQGQRTDLVDDKNNGVNEVERPTGNSTAAALRRLRKDRPDIHARVLAGELTANAGMNEAGFRKPRKSRKQTAFERAKGMLARLMPELSANERAHLVWMLHSGTLPSC